MGARGGHSFRCGGAAALEDGQAPVRQGLDPQGQGQARDGLGHRLGRHLRQLGQGVVEGQQIEQQLQTHLRRARCVGAVGGDRGRQGPGQAFQRPAADRGAGLARQGAAGDGGGGQALGPAHGPARRTQQLTRLTGQDVGQAQPLDFGRHARQAPPGASQAIDAAGQDVGIPREGRPAAEHLMPGQDHGQGLARAAVAGRHHGGHPGEAVQLDREGAAGSGAVPQGQRAVGVEAQSRQGQLARQQGARRLLGQGAEVARTDGEAFGGRAAQGQAVAGQAVELDPQLARRQPLGDRGPQARVGPSARAGADRRPHRRALEAGNVPLGQGDVAVARGEGAEGAHAAAAFKAWMLAA
ncbi:hypothetical protein D3C80_1093590 [compost metagenome]